MKTRIGRILVAITLLSTSIARAEIVFDNFQLGPPPTYSPTEWVGAASYTAFGAVARRAAARFTVNRASYTLNSITLPIGVEGIGSAYLRVRLTSDNGGVPGTTLEVLSEGQNIWPATYPLNSATQLVSIAHPTLTFGQSYWIVTELTAIPLGTTTFRWHMNPCGESVLFVNDAETGGLPTDPWGGLAGLPVAFRIEGDSLTPVQLEPPDWPHDPALNLPLAAGAGNQTQQVVVSDGQAGAIVAWANTVNGNSDIYAQRLGVLGHKLWTCSGVPITSQSATQTTPAMIADGSGGAFIVWPDLRGGTYYKLYAQRIDANGVALWIPEGIPIASGSGDQVHAVLASDGQGGVIVAWSDTRSLPVDVYAQRVSGNGGLLWGAGVPIATGTGAQWVPQIVSDGSGGAIIAWRDFRNASDYDIYAQRVNASGGILWALNGVVVTTALNDQTEVQLVSDELGGAIAVWLDARNNINSFDVYAQRLNSTGSLRWLNALPVCVAGGSQTNLRVMSDGVGGAIAVWQDPRNGSSDIYVEHVRSHGTTANVDGSYVAAGAQNEINPCLITDGAGGAFVTWQDFQSGNYNLQSARFDVHENVSWPWGFQPVSNAAGDQQLPVMASDGQGGAIVVWQDSRYPGSLYLYAQRFEHFGFLGNPEPTPLSVVDVPGEQGGQVLVTWSQSYLETQSPGVVGMYRLWRSVPSQAPGLSGLSASTYTTDPDLAVKTGQPLLVLSAGGTQAWEYVDAYIANGSPTYTMGTFTAQDSIAGGNPVTSFMIEARPSGNAVTPYFFSVPIHGYSIDNVAPSAPTGLSAVYGLGAIDLHWHPNPEFDIGFYRIYRGTTTDVQVGPASFFTSVPDTEYVGATDRSYVYKVTAVDIHGNESLWAMIAPWQTGIGNPLPARFVMSSPTPNPVRDKATIRWSLPERGIVRLELFDLTGRRVSVLENGPAEAGEHVRAIPLHDDSGRRVASGLYFLRLDWNGQSRTERIAVVR